MDGLVMFYPDDVLFVLAIASTGGRIRITGDHGDGTSIWRDRVRHDADCALRLVGTRNSFERYYRRFATVERQTIELGLAVASGDEQDGAAIGKILRISLGRRLTLIEGKLAVRATVSAQKPQMSSAAVRCTVLYGHDDVLEIGRKL